MEHNIKTESGLNLLTRLIPRPNINNLDAVLFPNGLNYNNIVEINGSSSSGKTMLITHLIKNAILVDKYNDVIVGGLNTAVILIDMDIKFSILMLIKMIKYSICNLKTKFKIDDRDEHCITELSLKNLIFIRCFNSDQLYYTLHRVREQITQDYRIALMFLDNLGSYYWQDIMLNGLCKMDLYKYKILRMLQKYVCNLNVAVIYTKPNYFESQPPVTDNKKPLLLTKINLSRTIESDKFIADVNRKYACRYMISSDGLNWVK